MLTLNRIQITKDIMFIIYSTCNQGLLNKSNTIVNRLLIKVIRLVYHIELSALNDDSMFGNKQ